MKYIKTEVTNAQNSSLPNSITVCYYHLCFFSYLPLLHLGAEILANTSTTQFFPTLCGSSLKSAVYTMGFSKCYKSELEIFLLMV